MLKKQDVFYTSEIPEDMWYEPLYNNSIRVYYEMLQHSVRRLDPVVANGIFIHEKENELHCLTSSDAHKYTETFK